jgi:hypothetical protein
MNEKELTDRIKNAIILLSDGHPFNVGDLTFGCDKKNNFFVSGWVESYELKNISKTSAVGIIVRKGKYGGTYAHKDIAFEFGSAISVPISGN